MNDETASRSERNPAPERDKPRRRQTVREAVGPSTAEKAGAQEQRVNIGNATRRDHNL